tara:strand:+ start:126 stop:1061 length:936 start_codon:yes stop_codon:yes gene_type:complete
MSPTFKIDLTPKIKDRVEDPNREVKDFDDVIELGMYGAYELGNHDDFKFLEQFKNIELKLEKNEQFVKMAQQMATVRDSFTQKLPKPDSPEFSTALANLNISLIDNPTFKSLVNGQNKLRKQMLKIAQPNQEFSDAIKRITQITEEHKRVWDSGANYHQAEVDRLQLDIDVKQIDLDIFDPRVDEVELQKAEMEMHKTEMVRMMTLVEKTDPIHVTKFSRVTYKKEMKPLETPTSPKHEKIYPTLQTDKIFRALKKYWDENLPEGKHPNGKRFWHDRKTYFQQLADEHELSFSRIEQIERYFRPVSFKPKR